MKRQSRLTAHLIVLIFVLVLVGCSSDSDDPTEEPSADPTPTAEISAQTEATSDVDALFPEDVTAETDSHGDNLPMFMGVADGAVEFSLEVFGPPIIEVVSVEETIELRVIVPRQPSGNSGIITIAMPADIAIGTHDIALITTASDSPITLTAQFDHLGDDELFTVVLLETLESATLTLIDTAPDNFTGEFIIEAQTNNGAVRLQADFEHLPITAEADMEETES